MSSTAAAECGQAFLCRRRNRKNDLVLTHASLHCRNLTKTLDYLEVFARFKDEENIKAVERLLNSHTELEMFERSQLGMFPFLSSSFLG